MTAALDGFYSTSEVAKLAGIHKDTLLRWLRAGLVPEPPRDHRGWRVFGRREAAQAIRLARSGESAHSAEDDSIARLNAVDWDFTGAKTSYLTHGLHPYPAKYIPQIPNALIQELSSVGDTVADIFCGSGTTLVEAVTLKRNSVGIDANPLATLISRAKTTRIDEQDLRDLQRLVDQANSISGQLSSHLVAGDDLFEASFESQGPRPDDESLNFWFEPFVIEELAEIRSWCLKQQSTAARAIADVAFSSIVVAVSKQDSDTRYVRREKSLLPGDVFSRFSRSLRDAIRASSEFTDVTEPRFHTTILNESLLNKPEIEPIDLMVCSPPYPNAYSYHLYHRTRMLWLGMDQPKFKQEEIGSHRKYSSHSRNAATINTFKNEMSCIFQWLRGSLKLGKYACFIVGDSTVRGERIDNAELLSTIGAATGYKEVSRIERTLQATKKSFNPKIGKIKTEKVLVLKKR